MSDKKKPMHPWRAWNPGSLKSTRSDHIIPDHIAASVNHDSSRTRTANRSRLGAGFGRGGYLK